jgi:hypothetical protein
VEEEGSAVYKAGIIVEKQVDLFSVIIGASKVFRDRKGPLNSPPV